MTKREKRIVELKEAIREGRYQPDSRTIADAIIRRAQARFHTARLFVR